MPPLNESAKPAITNSDTQIHAKMSSHLLPSVGTPTTPIVLPHADLTMSWNVGGYMCLPRIPPLYVLEKTRATIYGSSPAEVADRITSCLRVMSLDATYDDGRAAALVRDADGTEFHVRLFRDGDVTRPGIVVEVQKKRGCSFRFHRAARSVLRAAAGAPAARPPQGHAARPRKPVSAALLGRRRDTSESDGDKMDLALESAECLLKKDRVDAKLLGMESLVLLTDPESSGAERAAHAARALLRSSDAKFEDLRRILAATLRHEEGTADDDALPPSRDYERRHCDLMRRHAFAALANSLELMSRDAGDELRSVLDGGEWAGARGLLSSLVEELGSSEERPHHAYQAARCLNAVVGASFAMKKRAVELGAPSNVLISQEVGRCRHALLAGESDAALASLSSTK